MIKTNICICGELVSWDTERAHYRRFCDKCRSARRKLREQNVCRSRAGSTAVLVELGGPKILVTMERAADRTREEVGKMMGLSAERVRQIETTAMIKIMRQYRQLQDLQDLQDIT